MLMMRNIALPTRQITDIDRVTPKDTSATLSHQTWFTSYSAVWIMVILALLIMFVWFSGKIPRRCEFSRRLMRNKDPTHGYTTHHRSIQIIWTHRSGRGRGSGTTVGPVRSVGKIFLNIIDNCIFRLFMFARGSCYWYELGIVGFGRIVVLGIITTATLCLEVGHLLQVFWKKRRWSVAMDFLASCQLQSVLICPFYTSCDLNTNTF